LVSEYIGNPHLINGYKYDLRIYVVVTSFDPLRVYMLNEGLTRFATSQFNLKSKDVGKRFVHLTNFSVNKHSKQFVKNRSG
jgi:tubulin polyglutamylase TTLL4